MDNWVNELCPVCPSCGSENIWDYLGPHDYCCRDCFYEFDCEDLDDVADSSDISLE